MTAGPSLARDAVSCQHCDELACLGACASHPLSDEAPGDINRMNKTRFRDKVWASARTLMQDDSFPSLWLASSVRRAADAKFQYNWKQWLTDLAALGPRASPCRRMVAVLRTTYNTPQMLELAPELSRAVIELEYRRSEMQRREAHGCDEDERIAETKLMTRVRSAATHKKVPVTHFIRAAINATGDEPVPSNVPSDSSPTPGSISMIGDTATAIFNIHPPLSADIQTQASPIIEEIDSLINPFAADGLLSHCPMESLPQVHFPLYAIDPPANSFMYGNTDFPPEPLPYLCPLMKEMVMGRSDPLYLATHYCKLNETVKAVNIFKSALGCSDLAAMSEEAARLGLTPWHLMWLRLGDAILIRKRHGILPAASELLCELDVVFAELECEREYGDFSNEAHRTLQEAINRGNFAALATKGLILMDSPEEEMNGLELVLRAAHEDPCTVPRLLVARLTQRTSLLQTKTVEHAIAQLRARALESSVMALHVGALLSHEQAAECGYATNPRAARTMLQSCLAGIDVPRALRLQCASRLGHLAAYVDVDLELAATVLSKGAEARDSLCIAHLAALHLRRSRGEEAAALFRTLVTEHDERELYISALSETDNSQWVTYRFFLAESEEDRFLSEVAAGSCYPQHMTRERAHLYGELMTIELHDGNLLPPTGHSVA